MSRGRSQRIRTSHASAPAAEAWAEDRLREALEALPDGWQEMICLLLEDPRSSTNNPELTEADLGELGDPTTTGRRLMLAAMLEYASEAPGSAERGRGLLNQAVAQQSIYIQHLNDCLEDLEDLGDHVGQMPLKALERGTHAAELVQHRSLAGSINKATARALLRLMHAEEEVLASGIAQAAAGASDDDGNPQIPPVLSLLAERTREREILRLLAPSMTEALAQADRSRSRALLEAAARYTLEPSRAAQVSDRTLELGGMIGRDLDLLGNDPGLIVELLLGDDGELEELMGGVAASRSFGDRFRWGIGDLPVGSDLSGLAVRRMPWLAALPVAPDAESARAQALGILRSPEAFALDNGDKALEVSVAVSSEALRELLDQQPRLRLNRAVQTQRRWADDRPLRPRPGLPRHHEDKTVVYAVARENITIGERQVALRYLLPLGSEWENDASDAECLEQIGGPTGWWKHPALDAEILSLPAGVDSLGETAPGGKTTTARNTRSAIGDASCSHPDAVWRASGPGGETARLACPRCLRFAVASVPMHRLPDDLVIEQQTVAARLQDQETYLRLERLHRRIAGDDTPYSSISELRERDGLAAVDGEAYRYEAQSAAAHAGTGLRAAMNRR